MFWNPVLLNLQHYNYSSFSYNHIQVLEFTMDNKVWGSLSRISFQPLDGNWNIIIALFHLSVYMHTSSKWRSYKSFICRVCEQIVVMWGETQQLRRRVSKKSFLEWRDLNIDRLVFINCKFLRILTTHNHFKNTWWCSQV